jgi:glycosyltransferase involved in cell wall biosynthesis
MVPTIALVTHVYNREQYLPATIDSILAQTHPQFELLIWDDGSTDCSLAIAQQYKTRDQRIQVIGAPHRGSVLALQNAIAQTSAPYLGWVDSDDILCSTALEQTFAILDKHPEVGMVYTDYQDIDASGKLLGYGKRCRIPYSKDRLLIDFMTFHFRLIRRSVYDQVGGINATLSCAEDYDLCLRLSEVTPIYHLRRPLYLYRRHPHSITQQRQVEMIFTSRDVIAQALHRRGMSDRLEVHVELVGRFSLKPKG